MLIQPNALILFKTLDNTHMHMFKVFWNMNCFFKVGQAYTIHIFYLHMMWIIFDDTLVRNKNTF